MRDGRPCPPLTLQHTRALGSAPRKRPEDCWDLVGKCRGKGGARGFGNLRVFERPRSAGAPPSSRAAPRGADRATPSPGARGCSTELGQAGRPAADTWARETSEGLIHTFPSQVDSYEVTVEEELGDIHLVKIEKRKYWLHDDWYLKYITLKTPYGDYIEFPCYRWITGEGELVLRDGRGGRRGRSLRFREQSRDPLPQRAAPWLGTAALPQVLETPARRVEPAAQAQPAASSLRAAALQGQGCDPVLSGYLGSPVTNAGSVPLTGLSPGRQVCGWLSDPSRLGHPALCDVTEAPQRAEGRPNLQSAAAKLEVPLFAEREKNLKSAL